MKNFTHGLLSAAVVISLTASSSASADNIYEVLKNNPIAANTSVINHDATPWTIQDYVNNYRSANQRDETNSVATNRNATLWTIQDYVDNFRTSLEDIKG